MILRDILRTLERVESGQKELLDHLAALEKKAADGPETGPDGKAPDEWLQNGIDNILNYQAGKKRGDDR